MKPFETIAESTAADGSKLSLHRRDSDFFLRVNGQPLMATNAVESERVLANLACKGLGKRDAPRVLIGGLGFGFSLRRALELAPPDAVVEVAELLPEVIEWNREHLRKVNGKCLDDPRVEVLQEDVFEVVQRADEGRYQAILLDVDNGPVAMVQGQNDRLYEAQGFEMLKAAMSETAILAYWSAADDRPFTKRLSRAGFQVEAVPAKAYPQAKRAVHRVFVARKKPAWGGRRRR